MLTIDTCVLLAISSARGATLCSLDAAFVSAAQRLQWDARQLE